MPRSNVDIADRRNPYSKAYPSAPAFLDGGAVGARSKTPRAPQDKAYRATRASGSATTILDFDSIARSDRPDRWGSSEFIRTSPNAGREIARKGFTPGQTESLPSWLDDYSSSSTTASHRGASRASSYRPAKASASRVDSRYAPRGAAPYAPVRTARDSSARTQATGARDGRRNARADEVEDGQRRKETADPTLSERIGKMRHDRRHKKADREFTRTVSGDSAPTGEGAPRPGLYKGEMGRNHRKAARMQAAPQVKKAFRGGFSLAGWRDSPHFSTSLVVVVCIVMACGFIYPAAKDCYTAVRQQAQITAEYQAIQDRNAEIQGRIENLSTAEGIEDKAHEDYGWVKSGENSVSVATGGTTSIASDADNQTAAVATGSVPAPTTWYSPALDLLFGYSS